MPDVKAWIADPPRYLVAHYAVVGRTLAIAVVLALAVAWLASWLATREHHEATIHSQDALRSLLHLKPGKLPYVSVKTTGGMIFEGPLLTHDSSGDRADRRCNRVGWNMGCTRRMMRCKWVICRWDNRRL
jgi:hypothetical protein